jgi:digeranylgeranylglycerophospholipid reductase
MVRSKVTNASIPSEGEGSLCRLRSSTPRGEIEFECRTIVDASGFNSFIARSLGLVKDWTRYGIGAEYECYCENLDLDTWVLMVGSKYSDAGYAWVFPVSESRARIGVGVGRPESKLDPVEKLNQILDRRPEPLNQIGKIQPIELHRGFIPNDGPRAPMAHNKLLMVGDCAGQSNPLVLEGIRYAIEYGRLAGKVAMKYVSQNCNTDILIGYERMWKQKNQKSIASAQRVQRRWIGLSDEEWNHEIDILREMSIDEFIDFIKADFGICKLMKFGVNHPKAAYRQLLGLIKNA